MVFSVGILVELMKLDYLVVIISQYIHIVHPQLTQLYLNKVAKKKPFIFSHMILSRVTKKSDSKPPLPHSQIVEPFYESKTAI